MMNRWFGSVAFAAVMSLYLGCSEAELSQVPDTPSSTPKRNVLLITLDTIRADYLGCYGGKKAPTPVLDGIAASGSLFEHATVQVPLTTPSHASILTGTYPQVHGIRDVGGFILNRDVPTLASQLQGHGYRTGAFVSAAVLHERYGLNRGFATYNDDMKGLEEEEKLPGVVAEVRGHVIVERVVEWLGQVKNGEPFLIWAHFYDPHFPYDPPAPFHSDYKNDPYAGEVAYLDQVIGNLFTVLRERGLLEELLVIVVGDHGESLGEHGEQTHGVFLYESTMRVPLIVRGPGILSGKRVTQQVRSIDLAPTVLDYLGMEIPIEMQGLSLVPLLTEEQRLRTHVSYMETFYPKTQMRWSELKGIRTDRWKFILAPNPELYDLEADPSESENVLQRFPAEADRLQKQMWEIDGAPDSAKTIQAQPLDDETYRALMTLGYVSAGPSREIKADLSGSDPKDRVDILKGLDEATDLMNEGRFDQAVPILRKIVKIDSNNPLIYQNLGICLQESGRFQEALAIYQSAIDNQAETDRTYAELGEVQIRLGRMQVGIESLRKSSEINPRNLDNFSNLANAYLQIGELDEAHKAVQAILTQNARHANALNMQGMIRIQQRKPDLARQSFEKAIAADPELVEPYMNLGLLAQLAGNRSEAIRHFEAFLTRAQDPQYAEIVPRVEEALRKLKSGS